MRGTRVVATGAAIALASASAFARAPLASAGGGGHGPLVMASGYGYEEPTLLDPQRAGRLASMVMVMSGTGAADREPDGTARREVIELWAFRAGAVVLPAGAIGVSADCAAGAFTYRRECATGVVRYYPARGEAQAALLVESGMIYQLDAETLAIIEGAGLPLRVEPPSITVAPVAVEARALVSTYERVVRAAGALAIGLGAALIGGAVVAMLPARERRGVTLRHRGPARASWFDKLTMRSA